MRPNRKNMTRQYNLTRMTQLLTMRESLDGVNCRITGELYRRNEWQIEILIEPLIHLRLEVAIATVVLRGLIPSNLA